MDVILKILLVAILITLLLLIFGIIKTYYLLKRFEREATEEVIRTKKQLSQSLQNIFQDPFSKQDKSERKEAKIIDRK